MPLTRKDARMIAEELFALMQREKAVPERYLNAKEAAELLGMPLGTLYHKVGGIPHTKVGKRLRFTESTLRKYMG
ncbi:MAG: helix-turn-helix domain-containing protein [Prevotella conceptionensis]